MTRKDYEKIARVFAEFKAYGEAFANGQWRTVANEEFASRMADMLAQDNPRFDRSRFLKACEVKS